MTEKLKFVFPQRSKLNLILGKGMNPTNNIFQNQQGQVVKTEIKSDQDFVSESDLQKQANCLHIAVECNQGIICVLCGKKEKEN